MSAAEDYRLQARRWKRAQVREILHSEDRNAKVSGWPPGKQLEYAVLRAFELNNVKILSWPYAAQIGGDAVEQIDGAIESNGIRYLLEIKDQSSKQNIHPIYSLREKVLRRPPGTMGIVLAESFTDPAKTLARHAAPLCVLLWPLAHFTESFERGQLKAAIEDRYDYATMKCLPDYAEPEEVARL